MNKTSGKLVLAVRKVKTRRSAEVTPSPAPAEKPTKSQSRRSDSTNTFFPERVWPD